MSSDSLENSAPSTLTTEIASPAKIKRLAIRKDRYERILAFYNQNTRFPSNRSQDQDERSLGQFLTNQKSARLHGKTEPWENECLDNLGALHTRSVTVRKPLIQILQKILEYCLKYGNTPTQSSEDHEEKSLGRKLKSITDIRENLTQDEEVIFAKIMLYRTPHLKSRLEKLMDVLEFCKLNDRTPKQHVEDEDEKQKADFMSSTKSFLTKKTLSVAEQAIWDEIETYRRPSKSERAEILLDFCKENNRAPKVNSDNEEERKLATFMTKLKVTQKHGKLEAPLDDILKKILGICDIKSRIDKILSLREYIKGLGRQPIINSNDGEERRMAIFYNNVKQLRKNGKLKVDEISVLDEVTGLVSKPG